MTDFYEEDEGVDQVTAAFNAAQKQTTARTDIRGLLVSRPDPQWEAGDPERPVRINVFRTAYADLNADEAVQLAIQLLHHAGAEVTEDTALAAGIALGRQQVADTLRHAARGRQHYLGVARDPDIAREYPHKEGELQLEIATIESASMVAAGELGPLYNWLPSWLWTDEMNERLRPRRGTEAGE